jgi:uncharacterized membrane protein
MNKASLILGSFGLGAGLMYLFDPDRGKRRRSRIRDEVVHLRHEAEHAAGKVSRDLSNRVMGSFAEVGTIFECQEVDDSVLTERVRSRLGRAVSHPHAIHVEAEQGCVTLQGDILAREAESLMQQLYRVRGVKKIENRLHGHEHPDHIPSLQGGAAPMPRVRSSKWPTKAPATRFLMGVGGGAMTMYGARRKDPWSLFIGLGLLTRGVTNLKIKDLLGLKDRHGIKVQKTITIHAPVRKVYETWVKHENFPHFMSRVMEVKHLGNLRYHWKVAGPAGTTMEWEAVLTRLIPNKLIAWQSVPNSGIEQRGTVRFRSTENNDTVVDVRLSYYPPAGAVGHTIASLFGVDPKSEMDADLLRMKSYLESGIQPHDAAERHSQADLLSNPA